MTNCALGEPQRWTDRRGEARTSQRPVHGDLEVVSRAAFAAWTARRKSPHFSCEWRKEGAIGGQGAIFLLYFLSV